MQDKDLYVIAVMRYKEENPDLTEEELFPYDWNLNSNYHLKIEIIAEAIKNGVLRAIPDADVCVRPLADGGEGTVEALAPDRVYYYTTADQGSAHIYIDMEPVWYRHYYKQLPFLAESGIHSFPSFKTAVITAGACPRRMTVEMMVSYCSRRIPVSPDRDSSSSTRCS